MRAEHVMEPVVGWRVWNLCAEQDDLSLCAAGAGTDTTWPPRREFAATCGVPRLLSRGFRRHEAPDPSCRCGIYASDSLAFVARGWPAWPPPPVIGRVSLWGRVVAHEHGWRGRFAYPDRLRLVCVVCAWIEPGLGEPAVVHRFGRRLYTFCDAHAGGVEVPDGRRTDPVDTDPRTLRDRVLETYAVDLLPASSVDALCRRPPAPRQAAHIPTIRLLPAPGRSTR